MTDILNVIGMPKSVYYYHLNKSKTKTEDPIVNEIRQLKAGNKNYGYRPITLALKIKGYSVNHKKVLRLMKKHRLQGNAYNKKTAKYNSYKGTIGVVAPNRLNRKFNTDRPYQKLTADVTELRWGNKTTEERAYFQPIYDLYNGEVLTYAISLSPTVSFTLAPLVTALNQLPERSYRTTIHTDQGFQYQNKRWTATLMEHNVFQSMSRKGNCYDNAAMESFFHILKTETVNSNYYATYEEMVAAISKWIDYYNNERIKVKLGGKSPVNYRLESYKISV